MRNRMGLVVVAGAAFGALALGAAAGTRHPRAVVLDQDKKQLLVVDMTVGKVTTTLPYAGGWSASVAAMGDTRLLVLDQGRVETTFCCGPKPLSKSSATLIDTVNWRILWSQELGYGLDPLVAAGNGSRQSVSEVGRGITMDSASIAPDGRTAVVYCPGYLSKDPAETRPFELFAIDLVAGAIVSKTTLDRRLNSRLVFLTDGNHLLTFTEPGRNDKSGNAPPPELLAIDFRAGVVASRTPLDRQIDSTGLTSNGRTLVAFSHHRDPKKGVEYPSQLRLIDMATGSVRATFNLEGSPAGPMLASNGTLALTFVPADKKAKAHARVQFIDLAGGALLETLALEGQPVGATISKDGRFLYLVDPGRPSWELKKNVNGKILVISLSSRKIETVADAGSGPTVPLPSPIDGVVLVASNLAPVRENQFEKVGDLRVIRGQEVVATIRVGADFVFMRYSTNRDRLYVVTMNELTSIDTANWTPLGRIHFPPPPIDSPAPVPAALEISNEGGAGFLSFGDSSKLMVLDLEQHRTVASVATGRGFVKTAKGALAVAGTVAAFAALDAAKFADAVEGFDAYMSRHVSLVLRPDGKVAYALNSFTGDVTMVDQAGKVLGKVGSSCERLAVLGGGATIVLLGNDDLQVINTATNGKPSDLSLHTGIGNKMDLLATEDGQFGLALGQDEIQCLSGTTGQPIGDMIEADWRHIRVVDPGIF